MSYRPARISIKSQGRKNSSAAKNDRLELVISHWKKSEIYRFFRFLTPNFLFRPTIVAEIFEDFEPPSKNFLAMSLSKYIIWEMRKKNYNLNSISVFIWYPLSI